ncbi:hypothetical protein DL764_006107 [Monosporascus ibericus]|uniref:Uncharacterized protein n=1 Tax=Monosporascus ibericus TaxID=155417 RepID=A0A4Q4T9P2_9PEZI|nr:hypothetical protein DL764_006107 [Monosporascus ibericus]
MCKNHHLFHTCGCPVIDPETGEEENEIARCRAGKLLQRPKHKVDMANTPKSFGELPSNALPDKETQDFCASIRKRFRHVEVQGKKRGCTLKPSHCYIWADAMSREYNCCSFAVGELEEKLRPSPGGSWTWSTGGTGIAGHAATVHAHRILDAAAGCAPPGSGGFLVISHCRRFSSIPGRTSARYHWGIVKIKYPRHRERLEHLDAELTRTRSGRILKRTQASHP